LLIRDATKLQRAFSVYGKFGALHHGRGHHESQGRAPFHRLQRWQPPTGSVRVEALSQLEALHLPTAGLRSKSWDEFARSGAPPMNFVFTVCDNAANEVCPVWPGQPVTAHWCIPDPAAVKGAEEQVRKAFREAFLLLDRRITLFLNLPLSTMDRIALKKELDDIGRH
jgi:arsenate reductase